MTATSGGKTASVVNRVRVGRPWRHIARRGLEPAARYAQIARGYDLSKIETASLLDVSVSTVRKHLERGEKKLRTALGVPA